MLVFALVLPAYDSGIKIIKVSKQDKHLHIHLDILNLNAARRKGEKYFIYFKIGSQYWGRKNLILLMPCPPTTSGSVCACVLNHLMVWNTLHHAITQYSLIFSRTNAVAKIDRGLLVCVCVLKSDIYNLSAVLFCKMKQKLAYSDSQCFSSTYVFSCHLQLVGSTEHLPFKLHFSTTG